MDTQIPVQILYGKSQSRDTPVPFDRNFWEVISIFSFSSELL